MTFLAQSSTESGLPTLWQLIESGGPLMWPIGLCSVVALAYAVERAVRLREKHLGSRELGQSVVAALRAGGPTQALPLVERAETPLARVLKTALLLAGKAPSEREKRVEEVASAEVRKMSVPLRTLMLVYLVAPLLGLLGTVWGMIEAFATIAMKEGLGRPELLASGVYQALVTTAAGLTIAIPTVVVYYLLKARVDRFARRTEELYQEVDPLLEPVAVLAGAPSFPEVAVAHS